MDVRRELGQGQCFLLVSRGLADDAAGAPRTLAEVEGHAAAQVRQAEGNLAVPAIDRADQREHRVVLGNRQQLAVAARPAPRREVEAAHADFGEEGIGHGEG